MNPDREQWQQVKAALSVALRAPTSERVAVLERALAHAPALRDYAVDMLQHYDSVTQRFEMEDRASRLETLAPDVSSRPAVTSGSLIGPYRVVRRLGQGGMGVVYLARDERLGREVALKFLSFASGSPLEDLRQRLLAESRSAAALNHPAIVTLHDVFDTGSELVAVMEYVEGRPLSALIAAGPVPLGYALRLVSQIAEALAYAHARGIAHCDLKPANIHILPTGRPKILDFGLARALAARPDPPAAHQGTLVGTPGYIAPEQLLGREPGAASDVYALGVIFYQLLTGGLPFGSADVSRMLLDTLTEEPQPPSAAVHGVPAPVDDLVLRCMSRDPRLRLQPHELIQLLAPVLRQIEGRAADTQVVASESVAAPRTTSWTGAATAVVLSAGFVTLMGLATSASYDQPLGRVRQFAEESALDWPMWGVRSLVAVVGWSSIIVITALAIVAVARLAYTFTTPLHRAVTPALESTRRIGLRLTGVAGASIPSALLLSQLVVLGAIAWRFQPTLVGLDSFVSRRYQALEALAPQHEAEHRLLGESAATEVLVFGAAWFWEFRRRRGSTADRAGLHAWAGVVVTAGSLLFFQAVPFRIIYHNDAQRVSYGNERCYEVGHHQDEILLFCPLREPPWTRVVKAADPALRRGGPVENIFSGFDR